VPNYDFVCEKCGPFEQRRSFAEASNPMMCPSCEEEAKRVSSMPATTRMPAATLLNAVHRAEKSAHEPRVVRQPANGTWPGKRYRPSYGRPCGH
jgi:putative FmdB family regulatory protein